MTWDEFKEQKQAFPNYQITDIDCPRCGKKIYKKTDVVLACYPPKRVYECMDCGWRDYGPA